MRLQAVRIPLDVPTIRMYDQSMEFEWDEAKNQTSIRKHGLGFDTALRILEGTVAISADRRQHYGKERHISIGRVGADAVILVAHSERGGCIRLHLRPPSLTRGKEGLP